MTIDLGRSSSLPGLQKRLVSLKGRPDWKKVFWRTKKRDLTSLGSRSMENWPEEERFQKEKRNLENLRKVGHEAASVTDVRRFERYCLSFDEVSWPHKMISDTLTVPMEEQ